MREPVKEPTACHALNILSPEPRGDGVTGLGPRALNSAYRRWRNFANQCPSSGSPQAVPQSAWQPGKCAARPKNNQYGHADLPGAEAHRASDLSQREEQSTPVPFGAVVVSASTCDQSRPIWTSTSPRLACEPGQISRCAVSINSCAKERSMPGRLSSFTAIP